MEDVELVLRFFAYRQIAENPANGIKEMLDLYLRNANTTLEEDTLKEMRLVFFNIMKLTKEIFGEKSFLMFTERRGKFEWYSKPSKLVYDPMLMALSVYVDTPNADILIRNKEALIHILEEMFIDHVKDFNGRNNNKSDVIRREKLFKTALKKTIEGSMNG